MDPGTLRSTLNGLSEADVEKLRTACEDVLADPAPHTAESVAVCEVVASL